MKRIIRFILMVVLVMLVNQGLAFFKLDPLVRGFMVGAVTAIIMKIITGRIIE